MLSTAAFNGLLKTLEEPPAHVKFIFATTEIRKVPVTVLSRCQRFDLRRIDADTMVAYLQGIAGKEGISIAEDALRLLARASEGSARDALSLLDQAIAHGAVEGSGEIGEDALRDMLGLADRARIIDLFELLMSGKIDEALAELNEQYNSGADPAVILSDLAEFCHLLTRLKAAPNLPDQGAMSPREKERGTELAAQLSMRVLSSTWQILLKGIQEIASAPKPLAAADMVMVRLAYASDLPSPDEALKMLKSQGASGVAASPQPAGGSGSAASGQPSAQVAGNASQLGQPVPTRGAHLRSVATAPRMEIIAEPESNAVETLDEIDVGAVEEDQPQLASLGDIAQLASEKRDIPLKIDVERHLRLVRFEPGRIEVAVTGGGSAGIAGDLGKKLTGWTGRRWMVSVVHADGEPTLHEQKQAKANRKMEEVLHHPVVRATLEIFPGAEVVEVVDRDIKNKQDETQD